MELWVRGQNKSLLKQVFDIKIKEIENRTYKYGDIGKSNEFAIVSNDIILGCYETKERALEVLDEIQKLLQPQILIKKGKIAGSFDNTIIREADGFEIKELLTYVYEMPKE